MTLAEKAAALRATHQHHAERKAPVENGERLVTIQRHEGDELRLNWAEYNGHNFLNIRVWTQSDDGQLFPHRDKGLTVRIAELADFAEGVEQALKRALDGAQTPVGTQPALSRKIPHAKPKNTPKGRKRASKGISDAHKGSNATNMPPNDSLDDILPLLS